LVVLSPTVSGKEKARKRDKGNERKTTTGS
jgi:hypothetical protein